MEPFPEDDHTIIIRASNTNTDCKKYLVPFLFFKWFENLKKGAADRYVYEEAEEKLSPK